MKLVYNSNSMPVYVGDKVTLSDGEEFEIKYIQEPHKPASTGRVNGQVKGSDYESSFFPGVIKAHWIDREDQ